MILRLLYEVVLTNLKRRYNIYFNTNIINQF